VDAFPWASIGLDPCGILASERWIYRSGSIARAAEPLAASTPTIVYGSREEAGDPVDARLLARSLFPTASDHSAEGILRVLGLEAAARNEAATLLSLLAGLLRHAAGLSIEHRATLSQLLPAALGRLLRALDGLELAVERREAGSHPAPVRPRDVEPAVRGLEDAFDPQGPIASALSGFERRAGQEQLAHRIAAAIRERRSLAAEAGPGTGKTFAYLIPLLQHLHENPESRAVVSTRTRQLQEQLYHKDLPFLADRIAPRLRSAILKGRENYLCLRRWHIAVGEIAGGLDRELVAELAPITTWLVETDVGDVEQNVSLLTSPFRDRLWPRLRDNGRHCLMSACPHLEDCFSIGARRRAQRAQLVIVNHALLLADAAIGHRILGPYAILVADEAHALETAARDAYTATLDRSALEGLLAEVGAGTGPVRHGWLTRAGSQLASADQRAIAEGGRAVRGSGRRLFDALGEAIPQSPRARLARPPSLEPSASEHRAAVVRLRDAIQQAAENENDAEARAEAETLVNQAEGYAELLERTLGPPDKDAVLWSQRRPEGVSLHQSPLDVRAPLAATVYRALDSLILTSATLVPAADVGYLHDTIGTGEAPGDLEWLQLPPAFDYPRRMMLLVPRHLPPIEASMERHADGLASLIERLMTEIERRTLVLFTSYRLLDAVRERLRGVPGVIAQRPRDGRGALIDRLRAASGGAALLGADSFWEGVDLPGDLLEVLVITRLPFPVPTDPIVSALGDRLRMAGRDPFYDLSLPRAALKLRQGMGRLLRTATDRGAVLLTDDRLHRRSYGAFLASCLPVAPHAVGSEEETLQRLRAWFAADADAAPAP
jgi:ATP-dependent DNA helicase DinG